ncbi:hypothetical protein DFQ28_004890, partial [Apophysomyces sp. BC1034]
NEQELHEFNEDKQLQPVLAPAHKEKMRYLLGRISRFAINKIKNELNIARKHNVQPRDDCDCPTKINYDLPCKHTIPMVGPIGLDAISERWHLQPDVTYENTDEIPAKELVVRSVEE